VRRAASALLRMRYKCRCGYMVNACLLLVAARVQV
jgi:hypothetical protein